MAEELITYEGAEALALLLKDSGKVRVYLEFENVVAAETAVTPPTLDRGEGIVYYQGLSASDCRDFLRVDGVTRGVDSTDSVKFTTGNQLQLMGISSGTVGIHGKPFSHTAISKVFSAGVVLERDPDDWTQDLVICRFTLDSENHTVKQQSTPVSLQLPIGFS